MKKILRLCYRLKFPIGEKDIQRLREDVSHHLYAAKVSGESRYAIVNVLDEFCCNLMEHSGANWVELELTPLGDRVVTLLRDDGMAFDPIAAICKIHPRHPDAVTHRRLGLYLAGSLVQDMRYTRQGKFNCLEFSMRAL